MLSTIKKNTQYVKGNTGFTLIEVLIAMAIFSIGILGVAMLQSGSIRGNTSARGVTDIALIATDRLEMLRSLPYDDPALSDGVHVLNQETDRVDNNYNGLIDEDMPVVVIALMDPWYEKMFSQIEQVKARGGTVVAVATDGDDQIEAIADHVLWVPETPWMLSPVISVIPLQLLAYHIAALRGLDVDQPRNLAKSVTVE